MSNVKPLDLDIIWGTNADPGNIEDPGETKFRLGWVPEVPPLEFWNFTLNKFSHALAHINAQGFMNFDSGTNYQPYGIASASTSREPVLARSSTSLEPGVSNNWKRLFPSKFFKRSLEGISSRGRVVDGVPENTLAAINMAKKNGFDSILLSCRLSSDDVWVVIHDTTVNRTTNESETGEVNTFTVNQLQAMDVGSYIDPYYSNSRIPTMESAIRECARIGIKPILNIRPSAVGIAQLTDMVTITLRHFTTDEVMFYSFDTGNLSGIRNVDASAFVCVSATTINDLTINTIIALGNAAVRCNYPTTANVTRLLAADIPMIIEQNSSVSHLTQGVRAIISQGSNPRSLEN